MTGFGIVAVKVVPCPTCQASVKVIALAGSDTTSCPNGHGVHYSVKTGVVTKA